MTRHLKPADFTDILEGTRLNRSWISHLDRCDSCRETLAAVTVCFNDLREPDTNARITAADGGPDWSAFRSSVRDQLLARSVRKNSTVRAWTRGFAWKSRFLVSPSLRWSAFASVAVVLSVAAFAGLWHDSPIRRDQPGSGTDGIEMTSQTAEMPVSPFVDDEVTLEAESMAWSGTEIFVALNELDETEEQALLELLTLTLAEEGGV